MNSVRDFSEPSGFTHLIGRANGHWKYVLLNLLLRVTVKWRLGLEPDISAVRKQIGKLNRSVPVQIPGTERLPGDCKAVAGEWLVPESHNKNRVLLYIHGGAFIASSPDLYANMVAPWCKALGARALMVDYRLAPEHPYPAASDDCLSAYRWLLEQGFKPKDIVIAGDSAGGNLTMSTLLRLKNESMPMPSCAVLLSPFLDFTLSGRSALVNARRDPFFTPNFAMGIRTHYAPPELYSDPLVSPLLGDFTGLPPMLFQVGSTEMIRDDSVRAAAKANESGIPVQLEVWQSMPHVFQTIGALPQAEVAADRIVAFATKHTGWTR